MIKGGEENLSFGVESSQRIKNRINETHGHGATGLIRLDLNVGIQPTTVEELDQLLKGRQGLPGKFRREP